MAVLLTSKEIKNNTVLKYQLNNDIIVTIFFNKNFNEANFIIFDKLFKSITVNPIHLNNLEEFLLGYVNFIEESFDIIKILAELNNERN